MIIQIETAAVPSMREIMAADERPSRDLRR
jgi:hypothetical protein